MNFLIINHYAGSPHYGMEFRHYYLAKEFKKIGHTLTIIAADYSHIRNIQPNIEEDFQKEIIDGIDYYWIKTPKYEGSGIGRIINIFTFLYKLKCKSKSFFNNKKYDVVIASSTYPLDIFPAKSVAKKMGAKLVYEIHDLWPLSPMELGGYSKYHPFIMLLQYAENYAYKKCDKVISILPLTLEHAMSHGLKKEKWHNIPNGIDCSEWEDNKMNLPEHHKTIFENLKKENKKIILYAGTIGVANSLDNFLNAAKLSKNSNIQYIIAGKGPEKEALEKRVIKEEISNVTFLESVNKKLVPTLLSLSDILYVSFQKQSLFRFGISPNKIFDYMMSAKPVIQAIEAGNNIVADAKCGITIEPDNPEALKNAIDNILNLSNQKLEQLGNNGKKYVLANHNYTVLSKKFINIFE
ncbi:MAG: glycosyltransferase WbuB [Bacteroidetes bacterium GWF2_29_10]|nr:MAG: glycosyltransferase WbuB [Bacteroidetes bacterium GWF2_29_10]